MPNDGARSLSVVQHTEFTPAAQSRQGDARGGDPDRIEEAYREMEAFLDASLSGD